LARHKSVIVTSHILFSRKRKEKLSNEELVKIIVASNSHDEFGILYDRYSEKVYHKYISFVKDLALAQDLTHDIFLKTFINLSKFNHKSKFSTWLYSITYNVCID
jgi:DNA-directed RNA polymerase specialized sigma24 family protein